jgi:molybdopterin-guanine dinucleotide biosynthesis protein A
MGQPKAWVELGGETLLARGVRLMRGIVEQVVVVGSPDQEIPDVPVPAGIELTYAFDPVAYQGPLRGLAVGFEAMRDRADVALVRGVDGPFLARGWFDVLAQWLGDADLAIPRAGGYHQPLAAVYRVSRCLPEVQELLSANRLRPVDLLERVRAVEVDEAALREVDPELRTLWNLNTPEDLERGRAILREQGAR